MRIIAGSLGGRRLRTPTGESTRPTTDRVRESLFASLDSLGVVRGARVLDLFAGSGALGLEALSRGAASAVFVERSSAVVALLRGNVRELGVGARATVTTASVPAALGSLPEGGFDLVFADPPYPLGEAEVTDVLGAVVPLLSGLEALIVLERSSRSPEPVLPEGLEVHRTRTMGETALWMLQLAE